MKTEHGTSLWLTTRWVLAALCLVALMACVKNRPVEQQATIEQPQNTPPKIVPAEVAIADNPLKKKEEGVLARSGVTRSLTLRPVREPSVVPTCDMFFPVAAEGELKCVPRIDIRSQGLTSWMALEGPVQRSLEYALNMPQNQPALVRPGMTLTWAQVVRSLEEFLDLLPHLDREPDLLSSRFVWYGMKQKPVMTGYYTPEIEASLVREPGYEFPIYGVPEDLRYGRIRGVNKFYRVDKGRVLPYYERGDMDVKKVLEGRGLEIAWAKNPVDVFYMQVEGCGRLRLPDGTSRNVLYGAKNGLGFRSLGRILNAKGLLPRGKLSKEHVKEYFAKHPEKMFELMAENRSYVFFRLQDSPPEGTIGKPLTPMVSLATDRRLLPLGSLLAFEAEIPEAKDGRPVGKRRVAGIGLAQDTGTAIRGSRVDYYIGEGNAVEPIANNIKTEATVYLLVSKEALING